MLGRSWSGYQRFGAALAGRAEHAGTTAKLVGLPLLERAVIGSVAATSGISPEALRFWIRMVEPACDRSTVEHWGAATD